MRTTMGTCLRVYLILRTCTFIAILSGHVRYVYHCVVCGQMCVRVTVGMCLFYVYSCVYVYDCGFTAEARPTHAHAHTHTHTHTHTRGRRLNRFQILHKFMEARKRIVDFFFGSTHSRTNTRTHTYTHTHTHTHTHTRDRRLWRVSSSTEMHGDTKMNRGSFCVILVTAKLLLVSQCIYECAYECACVCVCVCATVSGCVCVCVFVYRYAKILPVYGCLGCKRELVIWGVSNVLSPRRHIVTYCNTLQTRSCTATRLYHALQRAYITHCNTPTTRCYCRLLNVWVCVCIRTRVCMHAHRCDMVAKKFTHIDIYA